MLPDIETIKNIASIAAPFTTAIIDTWVKPKLTSLFKSQKTDKLLFQHSIENKFNDYLIRSFETHSHINILIFQNRRKKLEDIYIPLTIKWKKNNEPIKVDSFREDIISIYRNILITDTAGMGKSTILKYLFLCCIQENKGLPILIELRKLTCERSILDFIYSELNPIDEEFDKDFVLSLIKRGDFIFFFDGYDEIPFNQRESVTRDLQQFISKASDNYFIMTSRPEAALLSFNNFYFFTIDPLKIDEAFTLLKKYDNSGEHSNEIIAKINGGTLKDINEFLTNPLLVSLLYKSYEYKPTIPIKKHLFYRQVYDSLFESHDLTKGGAFIREKHSKLDIDDFHRVLRCLGFITIKLGQIEFIKDHLLKLFCDIQQLTSGINFKGADFIKDLLTTVPLFTQEGQYYRWSHKSIQEYFAAQFICVDAKGNQDIILNRISISSNVEKYYNVLDLCYDIDYKSFRRTIIYALVRDFLDFYDSTYLDIDRIQIKEDDIHERKLLTFSCTMISLPVALIKSWREKDCDESDAFWIRHLRDCFPTSPQINQVFCTFNFRLGTKFSNAWQQFVHPSAVIIHLLHSKKENIILSECPSKKMHRESSIDNDDGFVVLDYPIIIDDNVKSDINKPNVFKKINKMLAWNDQLSESIIKYQLDVHKSRTLKNDIEIELCKEQSGNFLINDI